MAGRGPLPTKNPRRRNAPTVPTTNLPARGRTAAVPKPPAGVELGRAARAWWAWAWKTPQAAAWSAGDAYALARRARLEDDLEALELTDDFDLGELLMLDEDTDATRRLEEVIRKLKALAGGKMSVLREARELDDRFGLTARATAQLRWTIVPEVEDEVAKARTGRASRTVKAIDTSAVARR